MCGDQVHQTRLSEANSLATDSDQHHLITTRGLSIHEFQKESSLEHQAKTSFSSEAISPFSFDLFGGQRQMSFQQSSMLQSLQHQQSGLNDMQKVQQQAFIKKMEDLQRQQQLDPRQQNLFNQNSAFANQASGSQSSPNNGNPDSDQSHYAWMVDHGNTNWLHHASGGLPFTPNLGQTQRLVDFVPQQVDQSLHGVPVSSSRGLAVNQFSQMGTDRSPMPQIFTNSNSLPGRCTGLPDEISVQDRTFVSRQRFQNENMFGPCQALNTGIHMESLQQVNPMQINTLQEDFWGRQELSVPQESSTEISTKQIVSSQNEGSLDPMEQKILFGSDNNVWAAFGKSNNMSNETGNLFDNGGLLNGVPSLQSGSWSALMQSAAAETCSSDIGLQDEWSGLIYNNAEVPSANKHPSLYNNRGKQVASLAGDNVRLPSTMGSGSAAPCDGTNTNNRYHNFMGFNQFGPKFQDEPGQRLQSETSQRLVLMEEESKWLDNSLLQRVSEGSQRNRNASQPSLDVERNAKSISIPSAHEQSGSGQQPNGWNASAVVSYVGDQVVNDCEIGKLSLNSQSNPIRLIQGKVDDRHSSWKLNPTSSSTVELGSMKSFVGSPRVSKGCLNLNDAALVPNSVTSRVDEEISPFVQNNYLGYQWKNANSVVKSQGSDGLRRMLHQVNKGNKDAVERHEMKNYDLKENSNDSHQSDLSLCTSTGFRGHGMSGASDSRSLATEKQKSINEHGQKVSSPHKLQYHPMGNLDEDVEPSYGFKQPTHVQRMYSQNNELERSKFLGQIQKNSVVMEKVQSSDLQIDNKSPDEGPSIEYQPGHGRSVDTHTSNKASPSSQTMLDLLHKVDQSRENILMQFDSSKRNEPSQLPEAENWDGIVGCLQNTKSSASQGFGLQLGPPSQCMQIPDCLLSTRNAQHTFNSLHSSHAAGEIGEKDQLMAPTPSVQSFPFSNEHSQVEFEDIKSESPSKFSSVLKSTFPYSTSHLQNQHITRTPGHRSQHIDLSFDKNASLSIQKASAEAFSPDVSGSTPHDNLASLDDTSQRTGTNDPQERGSSAKMSAKDPVPASQPFFRPDILEHGASAQIGRNMWAKVPTLQNTHGTPYHNVSSNFLQSSLPNIVESSSSIPLARGDHDARKERSFPSEFGAIPTNSQGISGKEERLKGTSGQQLGKVSSINNPSDDSHAKSASKQKDIEAFSQSSKPNSFSHQNFSLLNQKWAMKDAETGPNNRVSKRMKGPDNGPSVHQVALNTGQSHEHNAYIGDSLGSNTAVSTGVPADLLESNVSSQHGNIATKLGFGQDFSQSNYLSDTTASINVEQPHVSPQMAPSRFNHYGTFKNGLMPHTVSPLRTAEPPRTLWKSSSNFHALGLMEHGTDATVDTCRVNGIQNSAPTVATGHKKRKSATSELLPWHKEISQRSQNLQIHSLAEVEWAKSANRVIEKVEDDVEFIEDGPPMHISKRRLILTTQLMQQLFRPPSAAIFSADASSNYKSVAYIVSRMALCDACCAVSCSSSPNMDCNGINLLAADGTPSNRNGDKHFAEVIEELMDRTRKLENEFLRLDNSSSILDLKVECQDLEKFSVINRFAKFHGRGQTNNTETALVSDVMANTQKTFPQRYVTALPMPRSVPDRVECLSL